MCSEECASFWGKWFGLGYTLLGKPFSADGSAPQCAQLLILATKPCLTLPFLPLLWPVTTAVRQKRLGLSFPNTILYLLHSGVVAAGCYGMNRISQTVDTLESKGLQVIDGLESRIISLSLTPHTECWYSSSAQVSSALPVFFPERLIYRF